MKILQCHSQGDKRFSAMYAQVKIGNETKTIEKWYQESKRDRNGNIPGKGKPVNYMVWNNKKYSANNLTKLYYSLWEWYFKQNPELLEYACQFDGYADKFKGKSINNQAKVIHDIVNKTKSEMLQNMSNEVTKERKDKITFTRMYNVKDNKKLKEIYSNVILEIATDNTEDLLDINGQIYRLKNLDYKVILQSPEGKLLPSRALGKYTKEHVNVTVPMNGNKVNMTAFRAKLNNLKSMMSHKEYVDVPVYEEPDCISAFDYKVPKTDEDGNVVTKTVEKTVYLDRVYTFSIYGKTVNHYGFIKGLAKSYKIPLAPVINGKIIDPDDESYLLDDCNENVIELIKKKYETISPKKKEMLLKFFGIHSKDIKISDFENFAYAMINFKMFRVDGLPLPNKVDAEEFMNMLYMFKVPNAYDLVYDMAEKGMLIHLEDYPELRQFEEARFYEDSYVEDEEDILD